MVRPHAVPIEAPYQPSQPRHSRPRPCSWRSVAAYECRSRSATADADRHTVWGTSRPTRCPRARLAANRLARSERQSSPTNVGPHRPRIRRSRRASGATTMAYAHNSTAWEALRCHPRRKSAGSSCRECGPGTLEMASSHDGIA